MKSLKNIAAAAIIAATFASGTVFATDGILVSNRDGILVSNKTKVRTTKPCKATVKVNAGILVSNVVGILVSNFTGILVSNVVETQPCDLSRDGLLISD